jgi:hypothetical protein
LSDALSLYLPDSRFYPTLSTLPVPDFTNPTSTAIFSSQAAIHNSLPILEEVVSLNEADEKETLDKEVANRRKRLHAGNAQRVRNEVVREVYGGSKVSSYCLYPYINLITLSYLPYTMKFSTTLILRTSFAVGRNRNNFATSETTFFLYLSTIQ